MKFVAARFDQFEEEMTRMVIVARGSGASPEELREFTLRLAGRRPYSAIDAAQKITRLFLDNYDWSETQQRL